MSIVPSAKPGNNRIAVARAAQRRIEAEVRIEVADVDVDQMHMMDARRRP